MKKYNFLQPPRGIADQVRWLKRLINQLDDFIVDNLFLDKKTTHTLTGFDLATHKLQSFRWHAVGDDATRPRQGTFKTY
jgi:hypothetical protein